MCQCFVAGTLILTEEGQKPIEEIQEGDYVYASHPDTGESGYKRVVQTFERETDEIVRLQINGETAYCARKRSAQRVNVDRTAKC